MLIFMSKLIEAGKKQRGLLDSQQKAMDVVYAALRRVAQGTLILHSPNYKHLNTCHYSNFLNRKNRWVLRIGQVLRYREK
ncbi:MAG: hypothetical protein R2788_21465 [Saprospiraceae bacterium]